MQKFAIQFSFFLTFALLAGCSEETEQTPSAIDALNARIEASSSSNDAELFANKNDGDRSRTGSDTRQSDSGDASNGESGPAEPNTMAKKILRNGLFPQIAETSSSTRFGGGLFPAVSDEMIDETSESGTESDDADTETVAETSAEQEMEISAMADNRKKVSLLPNAKQLFEEHSESEAINVLYANHLVSDVTRSEYKLNWIPGLKEPRLLFRWGVGVVYKQPRDFEGRHPVIGDPGDENEKTSSDSRGGTGRRGRGNTSGLGGGDITGSGGQRPRAGRGTRVYKNIDTSRPDGFLMYYTGDFGEKLISNLDSRRKDENHPFFGKILKDVMNVASAEGEDQQAEEEKPSTGRGVSGTLGFAGGGGGTSNRRSNNNSNAADDDNSIIERALGTAIATKPEDEFRGSIIPGVELLGVGSTEELFERAKSSGVDAMVIFNVRVSETRSTRQCVTSMRIVDVNTQENLFKSKALKDTDVDEDIEDGKDPVKDEVEKAFETVVDKQFRVTDLPSGLTEEVVKKRIGRLLNDKPASPLPAAVEIISYFDAKLLSEELTLTALIRLFGNDEAKVLVNGSPEERLDYLKEWLPEDIAI